MAPLCIKPEPEEQLAQFEPHAGDFFHLRDVTRHQLVQCVLVIPDGLSVPER